MRHMTLGVTAILALGCGSPCDDCDANAELWRACNEQWLTEFSFFRLCGDGTAKPGWFDENGEWTEDGFEEYDRDMHHCNSAQDVRADCKSLLIARESAASRSGLSDLRAECEDSEDSEVARAVRDVDCEAWLQAIGIL